MGKNDNYPVSARYEVGLIGDTVLRNASLYPDKDAFIDANRRVTFKQYNDHANSLINWLRDKGIKKGQVVGIIAWNCTEYAEIFGAAGKGGYILAPFNARVSPKELEYLINDSGASVLFMDSDFADTVIGLKSQTPGVKHIICFSPKQDTVSYTEILSKSSAAEPDLEQDHDDDPMLLLYTSGTTGTPKGALYTQGQWREDILSHNIEMHLDINDKGLLIMPYFHIGGIIWHSVFYYRGVTNYIMKNFDPRGLLKTIQDEKITNLCVVPTHIVELINLPDLDSFDTGSLKRVKYVGSPMPLELIKKAIKKWGPIFFQGYGQTETGPDICFLKEADHNVIYKSEAEQQKLRSCGRPVLDVHVRIVDEENNDVPPGETGEIIVHSRHLMKEYWNKPKETAETIIDGWLHTRDMGRMDEEGYIYLVDRKSDMIISGGENIYPREVEEVLYRHPAVLECAVIGIPDAKWVEAVHAVVVIKKGSAATKEDIIDFCKNNIARYKAPKSMEIVDALPKNASGKILKKELRLKWTNPK
jgi:long-chain acyl-CoA synthetase